MKNEINRDFYCSAESYEKISELCHFSNGLVFEFHPGKCRKSDCQHHHRKHPTPEQFKEEYGEEYPDDGLVWYRFPDDKKYEWLYTQYAKLRAILIEDWCKEHDKVIIVCACTPFGKPDYNWKPE
jgi:hypothetical protein